MNASTLAAAAVPAGSRANRLTTRSGRQYNLLAKARHHNRSAPALKPPGTRRPQAVDRIHKSWPAQLGRHTARGLASRGYLCYRRALVQCLLHLPEFVNFLNLARPACSNEQRCVLCSMASLAYTYWSDGPQVQTAVTDLDMSFEDWFRRHRFDNNLTIMNLHDRSVQQDPLEFLAQLVLPHSDHLNAGRSALAHSHQAQPLLERMFRFRITTNLTNPCGHNPGEVEDTFVSLQLEMARIRRRPGQTIGLARYIDIKYNNTRADPQCTRPGCNACRSGTATETIRIRTAPLVLPVALIRVNEAGRKIHDPVSIPETLDLSAYTERGNTLRYRLRAMLCHIGYTNHGGHYVAVVKEPNAAHSICNDSLVNTLAVPFDRLVFANPTLHHHSLGAYALFYTKI